MADKSEGGTVAQADFARTLAALKRRGSNVLLVGPETAEGHGALCHRLLGENVASRYRLLVTDSRTRTVQSCHESSVSCSTHETPTTRTIDYATAGAGATGERSGDHAPLEALGTDIAEAITAFDADADGLEPAQLRVCFDSLVSLLERHAAEPVFRLLHMVTARVSHVRGMGHYHVPVTRDHDAVSLLEPLFDGIVEVRTRDGAYDQRWHLQERETTTEWLPV
ncbi:DUF7504 family protein [Natronolimnohabitans innermongolicus]|uniref:Uncharacterized protein n=1 Tax=Natronolimnohabitans innermongolicus JCM 12255 TaxID=1227499 RepID=L9XK13_9EURY|nr:hypothetical protein [Natronolimnohabitans innermongolicus]ELY62109.1 hypothetical protein C493_00800 [Natronolimnohabitans innermongolicus JCM 12255]